MGRPLRFIPPGSLVEVTTRTVQGRLLLRPSPELNDIVLGVLGRAQALFGMELHAFAVMSNHVHLLLSPRDAAQLAAFMAHVNGNIAREAGRVYDWRERFWGRRYRAIVVMDETAQVGRLRYLVAQGCKEGLVAQAQDWPGASCVLALTQGTALAGHWFDRTAEHAARRKGQTPSPHEFATLCSVTLSPLPCWRHLEADTRRVLCQDLVRQVEQDARIALGGRSPMGRERICNQDPHSRPAHIDETPAPCVHATEPSMRQVFRQAYRVFVDAYRTAAGLLRLGDRDAQFPQHAFPPALAFSRPADGGADPLWAALSLAAATPARAVLVPT